jgi:hypothetical protein
VPLGSKYNWLTVPQFGQGTLTAATVLGPAAKPFPSHFSVTPTGRLQVQHAKSSVTSSSIIIWSAPRVETRMGSPSEPGTPHAEPIQGRKKVGRAAGKNKKEKVTPFSFHLAGF